MRYLDVCAGISAATVAWKPLGWQAVAYSEIEKFPSAVLKHHYPDTPNWGDMTKYEEWPDVAIDLLVGGTPCQSFSVAGLRKGLDDPRGDLMLTYLAIARRYRPRWVVWENVPGVLSVDDGRAFGTFLGGLGERGYGFAYRILDAQYFGVPQRRRRVFVVGYLGDWRPAAAVLLERESLQGNPPPRRDAGQGVAALTASGVGTCGADDNQAQAGHLVAATLQAKDGRGVHSDMQNFVAHSLRGEGFDASEDGTGRGTPIVPICFNSREDPDVTGDRAGALGSSSPQAQAVAWWIMPQNSGRDFKARPVDVAQPVMAGGPVGGNQGGDYIQQHSAVRRLTPTECERLQGFPDGYTAIPWRGKPAEQCPDGPRYKGLGNSKCTKVVRWLGERISAVDEIMTTHQEAAQ